MCVEGLGSGRVREGKGGETGCVKGPLEGVCAG